MRLLLIASVLALTACKTPVGVSVVSSSPVQISVPLPGASPLVLTCSPNTFVCEGDYSYGGTTVHVTASKIVRHK